jgi:hypothetical protein
MGKPCSVFLAIVDFIRVQFPMVNLAFTARLGLDVCSKFGFGGNSSLWSTWHLLLGWV